MNRPIVFLDIDGVLATLETYQRGRGEDHVERIRSGEPDAILAHDRSLLDEGCIARLNELTRRTGAAIVVSSSWRHDPDIVDRLKAVGVEAEIVGRTPAHPYPAHRGSEIGAWRVEAGHDGPFVILDDEDDMGTYLPRLVQSSFTKGGLQQEHVERAVVLLNAHSDPFGDWGRA